jgi:hypothetical protein
MMARVLPSPYSCNVTGRSQAVKHFLFNCFPDAGVDRQDVRHHRVPDIVAAILGVVVAGIVNRRNASADAPQGKVRLLCCEKRTDKLIALVWDQEWVAVHTGKDPVLYLIIKVVCCDDRQVSCFCEKLVSTISPPCFLRNTGRHFFLAPSNGDG